MRAVAFVLAVAAPFQASALFDGAQRALRSYYNCSLYENPTSAASRADSMLKPAVASVLRLGSYM